MEKLGRKYERNRNKCLIIILIMKYNDLFFDQWIVINYGSYAHGTNKTNGNISALTLKSGQLEYALRCNPNSKKGKSRELWNELCKYETEYNPSFF
jgi:hypothetical protein